jgi:4-coumarate--CoA ligase (photoactive yellow protein activation family)
MSTLHFTPDRCFSLVRSLVCDEARRLRRRSDPFLEELGLGWESQLRQPPFELTPEELASVCARVARFFCCESLEPESLSALPRLGDWAERVASGWGRAPMAVGFSTSGSLGNPKPVRHELWLLIQDARATVEAFASRGKTIGRVVGLVPPHHIYGFIHTALLPLLFGLDCVDLRGRPPAALAEALRPGDLLVGAPFHWKGLAQSHVRLPGVLLLSSGAACPPEPLSLLETRGVEAWVELYGSTECAAMGFRTSVGEPMTLCPLWERVEQDGFARRRPDGGLTPAFHFQDRLEWVDEKRFFVGGRRDEAVQIGGVNVFPALVERCLANHPLVAACVVRPMRPEEGDRLKAFVVPKDSRIPTLELRRELRDYLSQRVQPLELPRAFCFGEALPRSIMGKPMDWA